MDFIEQHCVHLTSSVLYAQLHSALLLVVTRPNTFGKIYQDKSEFSIVPDYQLRGASLHIAISDQFFGFCIPNYCFL